MYERRAEKGSEGPRRPVRAKPRASLLLLSDSSSSDDQDQKYPSSDDHGRPRSPFFSSMRYSHMEIPLHFLSMGGQLSDSSEDAIGKCIRRLLNVVVSDLRLQLGFATVSAAGEISAAYSFTGRPSSLSPGSPKLLDLYAEEEREILLELRVPASAVGSHRILALRSSYIDRLTCEKICGKEQSIIVPRPHGVRSSEPKMQQLRTLFLITKAVAESRRLAERGDLKGAYHLLSSAWALLSAQPSSSTATVEEFQRMVEAEIGEVEQSRKFQLRVMAQRQRWWTTVPAGTGAVCVDEKGHPLTPLSAWKAAERLAKVAIMSTSMNRVSDLHGFENAGF